MTTILLPESPADQQRNRPTGPHNEPVASLVQLGIVAVLTIIVMLVVIFWPRQ